jgi:ADP-heptose:LPS heptosyltransferase
VLIACDPAEGRKSDAAAWPEERWIALGEGCVAAGLRPVLIGLHPAPELADHMTLHLPRAVDLTGQISVSDMVFLAWAAKAAVGCDNGVMHLAAAANCRSVVLYDTHSDPAWTGQRGRAVTILRRARVTDIPVSEVMATLQRPA